MSARFFLVLAFVMTCLCFSTVLAQVSLVPSDRLDEVHAPVHGREEAFTLMPDVSNGGSSHVQQWYYVPNVPRLSLKKSSNGLQPEFSFLRYQLPDPENPDSLVEGGWLSFSISLAIPEETRNTLVERIAQRKSIPKQHIVLSALPIDSATVHLYTPPRHLKTGYVLNSSADRTVGIAPVFATQQLAFLIKLDRLHADELEPLIEGQTGLPVAITMTYRGLSPPAGFRITVDYDRLFQLYSSDHRIRAEATYWGLYGASLNVMADELVKTLVTNKCIEVEFIESESLDRRHLHDFLQPLLARIHDNLFETLKPPSSLKLARNMGHARIGLLLNAGWTSAFKADRDRRKGTETITFKGRYMQSRTSVASGFIGVGDFLRRDPALRRRLIVQAGTRTWRSAYFLLPTISNHRNVDIASIALTVEMRLKGKRLLDQQLREWTPAKGWTNTRGKPSTLIVFPLEGLDLSDVDRAGLRYSTKTTVTTGRDDILAVSSSLPAFEGATAITTPLAALDVVEIDGRGLPWQELRRGAVTNVGVVLTSDNRKFVTSIRPSARNGTFCPPRPLCWLIHKNNPVFLDVYIQENGKRRRWAGSGNLRKQFPSLSVYLE